MKRDFFISVFLVATIFVFGGCVTTSPTVYDEILTYEVPYDAGYLAITEKGDQLPNWILEETSKSDGLISFRGVGASGKKVIFIVKNLDKELISMELAKDSQSTKNAGKLLKSLDETVLKLQKQREKQNSEG